MAGIALVLLAGLVALLPIRPPENVRPADAEGHAG
jgi:hypothetical protein